MWQQLAHENQTRAAKQQKSFHDARAQAHEFKVGDTVWLYRRSQAERGLTSKLAYKWCGPYKVTKKVGDVTYILSDEQGNELPGTAHARLMYRQEEDPPARARSPEGRQV